MDVEVKTGKSVSATKSNSKSSGSKKKARKANKLIKAAYGKPTRELLQSISPYLATLRNPFEVTGVKVPTLAGILPSGVCQTIQRGQLAINSVGVTGIEVILGLQPASLTYGCGTRTMTSASSSGTYAWNSLTDFGFRASLVASSSATRIVSAGLAWFYTGSPLNAKGRAIQYFSPPAVSDVSVYSVNSSAAMSHPYARVMPLSRKSGAMIFAPQDVNVVTYVKPLFYSNINESMFGFYVDGGTPADTIDYVLVINWEFLPNGTTGILVNATTPPVSDAAEFELAQNYFANDPAATSSVPAKMAMESATQPLAGGGSSAHQVVEHHPSQKKSLMEKIFDGVEKAIPVAGKIAEMALPLLAL